MAKRKSAYLGYTEAEVTKIENQLFVLVFGGDFFIQDNCYLFTHAEVAKAYRNTLKDLIGIVDDGTDKDRAYALDLIAGLRVQRMRLH